MNIWQIQDWAKQQDEEEPEFNLINKHNIKFEGKFVNKGFGFVEIFVLGEGFISLMHLSKEYGAENLIFEPIETNSKE
jgi:hypothetical protein